MGKKYSILVIDDNVEPLSLAVIRCLGTLKNVNIHVLSLDKLKWPSFKFSRFVQSYSWESVQNDEQAFEVIVKLIGKVKADVILPMKEKTVRILAERFFKFQEFTNLPPMPDPAILEIVRNKWLLYNWLFDNSFIQSRPIQYKDLIQNNPDMKSIVFPLLIKPHWGSGGRGISRINNIQELMHFRPDKEFKVEELLIQPFIPGFDIDISVLAENGEVLAYTIQKGFDHGNKFVYSKAIEFLYDDKLYQLSLQILRKLKYSGIAHLDFRYNPEDDTYSLIDFNARFWSSILGSLNAGINFPWLACQRALGKDVSKTSYRLETYYMTHSIKGFLPVNIKNRQSLFNSETKFVMRDILPLFMQIVKKLLVPFKKLFGI